MRALVLVGGQGTRLRPLTYSVPKPLLPVAGRPMIVHTLEWLARHGIDEVVFSLGYRPDAFLEAFPEANLAGVRLQYAVEPEPLDTAGAIRFAAEYAGAMGERVVVVNGDVLTDLDLTALIAFHEETGAEGSIHLTAVDNPSAFGVVPVDQAGRVTAFIEKPAPGTESTNYINAGTYVLEPAALARIPGGRRCSIERATFPEMVLDGVLYARADDSYWIDTGTPASYLAAQFDLLSGARPFATLPPECAPVASMVNVGPGSTLDGDARPPVLVGSDSVVHTGAELDRCVIGNRVVVEPGALVRGSVVLDGTVIRAGAVIEDSVVGANCVIGEGASLRAMTIVGSGESIEAGCSLDSARVPV